MNPNEVISIQCSACFLLQPPWLPGSAGWEVGCMLLIVPIALPPVLLGHSLSGLLFPAVCCILLLYKIWMVFWSLPALYGMLEYCYA